MGQEWRTCHDPSGSSGIEQLRLSRLHEDEGTPNSTTAHRLSRRPWDRSHFRYSARWWDRTVFSDENGSSWTVSTAPHTIGLTRVFRRELVSAAKVAPKHCWSGALIASVRSIPGFEDVNIVVMKYTSMLADVLLLFCGKSYKNGCRFEQDDPSTHNTQRTKDWFVIEG